MLAPDLYDEICSAVFEEPTSRETKEASKETKKTIVALTLTSRLLHSIAIKYLWKSIPSIYPLTKCFPDTVWNSTTNVLQRELQLSDLTRFQFFAKFVSYYGPRAYWDTEKDVDTEVYAKLYSISIALNQPLLPNVKDVFLNYEADFEKASYTAALFGDRVSRYNAHFSLPRSGPHPLPDILLSGQVQNFKDATNFIFSKNPNLQHLILHPDPHPELTQTISESLCSFRGTLRSLDLSAILPIGASHIALLPKLEQLQLRMLNKTYDPFREVRRTAGNHTNTYFPSLRRLKIHCQGTSICVSILSLLSANSAISKAKFRCEEPRTAGWKKIIDLLPKRLQVGTLKSLSFQDLYLPHRTGQDEDWSSVHLEPLLVFRNLERFEVEIHGAFNLDDDIVTRMAQSWTKIQCLRLYSPEDEAETRKVTLHGIQALARNCPELVTLIMSFNARIPAYGLPKLTDPSLCKLKELNVVCSPIDNSAMVASFLRDNFPYLEGFSQLPKGGMGGFDEWDWIQEELGLVEGVI